LLKHAPEDFSDAGESKGYKMSGEKCGAIRGDHAERMLRVIRQNPCLATGADVSVVQAKLAKALDWGRAVVAKSMRDNPQDYYFAEDHVRGGVILFIRKPSLVTA
jgi:hypothetical protein